MGNIDNMTDEGYKYNRNNMGNRVDICNEGNKGNRGNMSNKGNKGNRGNMGNRETKLTRVTEITWVTKLTRENKHLITTTHHAHVATYLQTFNNTSSSCSWNSKIVGCLCLKIFKFIVALPCSSSLAMGRPVVSRCNRNNMGSNGNRGYMSKRDNMGKEG